MSRVNECNGGVQQGLAEPRCLSLSHSPVEDVNITGQEQVLPHSIAQNAHLRASDAT
jgi:hypothetical protein